MKAGALALISSLSLGWVLWIVQPEVAFAEFQKLPIWLIPAITLVFLFNLAVVTLRLHLLLKYFNFNAGITVTFQATLQGCLMSLFLLPIMGHVLGRQSFLSRVGVSPVLNAAIVAMEKGILLLVTVTAALVGILWLLGLEKAAGSISKATLFQIPLVLTLSYITLLRFGGDKWKIKQFTGKRARRHLTYFLGLLILTLVTHILTLSAYILAAKALAPHISFPSLSSAAAITSFMASLPISVNGWGVREYAAISAFGYVNLNEASALAVSILVGFCSTIAILITWPSYLIKTKYICQETVPAEQIADHNLAERVAIWALAMAGASFIFFQIHIKIYDGVINLNLADPIAALALTIVITTFFLSGKLPVWRVPRLNALLFILWLLILLAFINGVYAVGVTTWALAGKFLGYLILLG